MATNERKRTQLSRREVLGLMGAAGVIAVVGCGDDDPPATSETAATASTTATRSATTAPTQAATVSATPEPVACVVTPAQTEGPYFVDEKLNRSDLTTDPTDGSVREGVPLRLALTVSNVQGSTCTPVEGAVVDMWHCDALGVYSDVSGAGQASTVGQKFLRGYQVTDATGRVEFQTIYPGWYMGRTPHIHFKVRTEPDANQGFEFTSQLYFDEALSDSLYATREPYSSKGAADTTNSRDGIFSEETMVTLTEDRQGYAGTFHVGVNVA